MEANLSPPPNLTEQAEAAQQSPLSHHPPTSQNMAAQDESTMLATGRLNFDGSTAAIRPQAAEEEDGEKRAVAMFNDRMETMSAES